MFEEALKLAVDPEGDAQGDAGEHAAAEHSGAPRTRDDTPGSTGRFRLCFGEKMRGGW